MAQIMLIVLKHAKCYIFNYLLWITNLLLSEMAPESDSNSSSYKFIKIDSKFTTIQANLLFLRTVFLSHLKIEIASSRGGRVWVRERRHEGSMNGIVEMLVRFFNGLSEDKEDEDDILWFNSSNSH